MIEISRGDNAFQYRQREDEPRPGGTRIESRANYRGARWNFVARYPTAEEARQSLLAIAKKNERLKEDD